VEKKVLNIGVMSLADFRDRTIAIAKGEYTPSGNEPKIWFESLKALGEVLGERNQKLLRVIHDNEPASLKELAILTGRHVSNLSRTLRHMENFGLVELHRTGRKVRPVVSATEFRVEFRL